MGFDVEIWFDKFFMVGYLVKKNFVFFFLYNFLFDIEYGYYFDFLKFGWFLCECVKLRGVYYVVGNIELVYILLFGDILYFVC